MEYKPLNRSMIAAKASKQDEFYTQLSDIEKELRHYTAHFKDKTVLCNCDDPRVSNFFHYFSFNFEKLRLKRLVTTCYKNNRADLFSRNDSERGIYPYVLDGDERHLNIRAFTDNMKTEAYERQKGLCKKCGKHFELAEMEADHITPWREGGKTIAANCQMLCKDDNRRKSGK